MQIINFLKKGASVASLRKFLDVGLITDFKTGKMVENKKTQSANERSERPEIFLIFLVKKLIFTEKKALILDKNCQKINV